MNTRASADAMRLNWFRSEPPILSCAISSFAM